MLIYLKNDISAKFHEDLMKNKPLNIVGTFRHFLEEMAQILGLFVKKSLWWPPIFFDKLLIYLKIDISAKFHEDPMKNEVVRASQSWKKSSEGVNVDERSLWNKTNNK